MQPRKKYKSELQTDPVELMAWAPGTQGIPTTLHVPYWTRRSAPGVVVRTMVETLLSATETGSWRPLLDAGHAEAAGPIQPPPPQPKMERGKGGGGWMNKCIELMAALWDTDYDHASELMGQWLVHNSTAADLVARTAGVCVVKHMCWKLL